MGTKGRKPQKMSADPPPKTADDLVLEYLRGMPERRLHTETIVPLLKARGASHVQYVHGAFERGKDIVFVSEDFYGDPRLEVCQVKNEPFTGRATDSNFTFGLLNQLNQAREIEVLNPATHTLERPAAVSLISTYAIHDKDVAGASAFLAKLKSNSVKIVGPDDLLRLLKRYLPTYYAEIACPGEGLVKALRTHLAFHQEAAAFDLSSKRALSDFFVNLGLVTAGTVLRRLADGRLPHQWRIDLELRADQFARIAEIQSALPSPLDDIQVLVHGRETAGNLGTQRKVEQVTFSEFLVEVAVLAEEELGGEVNQRSSDGRLGSVLQLLSSSNEFLLATYRLIQQATSAKPTERHGDNPIPLEIPSVAPSELLDFDLPLCVIGQAGAGKTSLARMLAQSAFDREIRCIYFPCTQVQAKTVTLMGAMRDFLLALDPSADREVVQKMIDEAQLFILDGCDEASTFSSTLGEQIKRLAFRSSIAVKLRDRPDDAFYIPPDLANALVYDAPNRELKLLAPLSVLGFARVLHLNRGTAYEGALKLLQKKKAELNPRVIVTTRETGSLKLAPDFLRVSVLPFNDQQLREFFARWFKDNPTDADTVLRFLDRNRHIREVCRTPMVATIVAALHENGYELPTSKSEVYQRRFHLLLEKWDRSKGIVRRNMVKFDDKMMLLSRQAYTMHHEHRRTFALSELVSLWNQTLRKRYPHIDPTELAWELRVVNNVIVPSGDGSYWLGHLSFQEYLAAYAIVLGQRANELIESFFDPWWNQVLVFYAGIAKDVEIFLRRIQTRYSLPAAKSDVFAAMIEEASFTSTNVHDAIADMLADDAIGGDSLSDYDDPSVGSDLE